jgi:putative tricarboxylic transport membrane protein
MKKDDRQLVFQNGLHLCATIFSLLILMVVNGEAADPSANYPSRPIELVVHLGPGSNSDMFARMVTDIIQKEKVFSQPMVVVNKPGSGGAVSLAYTFERKGNPHLVLSVTLTTFICTPLLEKLPYNYKSFVPIANLVSEGGVLVVKGDSPFKTIDDLIVEAKKRPKELLQGGGSLTSNEALMGQSMQKAKGVKWNFISFAGGGSEALLNLLGGNVHFAYTDPSVVLDYVRAGKLRVLLAGAPVRYPQFKDAPTCKEAGLGEPFMAYRGFVGPPNMPDYAVKKLEAAFKKVIEHSQFKKFIGDMSLPTWMSPNEFSKFLDNENNRWKELLTDLNLVKK